MYCDLPEFSSTIKRKARKNHQCVACPCGIRTGDVYFEFSGMWEHEYYRFRVCEHCHALHEAVASDSDDGCWGFDDVWDYPAYAGDSFVIPDDARVCRNMIIVQESMSAP